MAIIEMTTRSSTTVKPPDHLSPLATNWCLASGAEADGRSIPTARPARISFSLIPAFSFLKLVTIVIQLWPVQGLILIAASRV